MGKKRITFLINSMGLGGAEHQTVYQLNELVRRGWDIQLIVLSNNNPLLKSLDPSVFVVTLGKDSLNSLSYTSIAPLFSTIPTVYRALRKFNSDAIVAIMPMAHLVGRLLKFFFKTQVKLWIYQRSTDYAINPPIGWVKETFLTLKKNFLIKHDYGQIYISQAVKEDIEKFENVKNGYILHNSSPDKSDTQETDILSRLGLESLSYHIIPGRFHKVKGHLFFLDSCHVDIIASNELIVFAGYGPMEAKIREAIQKYSLENHIILTGKIDNNDMLTLIKNAKFTIVPSLMEGFGNVAVESLMMSTTPVVSDAGGLKEIVTHNSNGYVFKGGNQEELARIYHEISTGKIKKIEPTILYNSYKNKFGFDAHVERLEYILGK